MTKSSYIKGKSEEMSTGEKEEREKISAKLKKRIEELDEIINELEKSKEGGEKKQSWEYRYLVGGFKKPS